MRRLGIIFASVFVVTLVIGSAAQACGWRQGWSRWCGTSCCVSSCWTVTTCCPTVCCDAWTVCESEVILPAVCEPAGTTISPLTEMPPAEPTPAEAPPPSPTQQAAPPVPAPEPSAAEQPAPSLAPAPTAGEVPEVPAPAAPGTDAPAAPEPAMPAPAEPPAAPVLEPTPVTPTPEAAPATPAAEPAPPAPAEQPETPQPTPAEDPFGAGTGDPFSQHQPRTWRDNTGQYTVEATYLATLADGAVSLKRSVDGRTIRVPFERLSAADQDLVRGTAPVVALNN